MPLDAQARQWVKVLERQQQQLDSELAMKLFEAYRELMGDKRRWAALPATEQAAWTRVARRASGIIAGRFTT